MKITKLCEEFPWTTVPRTPGLHLTDIISDILLTLSVAKKYDDADPCLQYEKGYLWEVVLSYAFAEKVIYQIGEVELDGIICSPDGVSYGNSDNLIVEENKCTAKSSKRSPDENIDWDANDYSPPGVMTGNEIVLNTPSVGVASLAYTDSYNYSKNDLIVIKLDLTDDAGDSDLPVINFDGIAIQINEWGTTWLSYRVNADGSDTFKLAHDVGTKAVMTAVVTLYSIS